MKVISYNVNGIRAALKKGFVDWLKSEDPDVICLQEIKVDEANAPKAIFDDLGYYQYWNSAEKKGYSGVATFSKKQADEVNVGMNNEKYDIEGRILRTEIDGVNIYNCYFPSGSSSEERHGFKMEFLKDFRLWMKTQAIQYPSNIVLGDYNIVHTELDIHNPERKDNPSGYRPEERAWLTDWFNGDYTDAFRQLHPEKVEFSWWSYRAGARAKDKGWRIDYIALTEDLTNGLKNAAHLKEAVHSDHCPVKVELA